jgi:prepilin-type N-terminal cleavage/methylation domain-containing protein
MTRGLTLLEVLAATVLLAMIAAAVAPALLQASLALKASPGVDHIGMSVIADTFIENPELFNLKDHNWVLEQEQIELAMPDDLQWIEIQQFTVQVQRSASTESSHAWFVFESTRDGVGGGEIACRWLALPQLSDRETSP